VVKINGQMRKFFIFLLLCAGGLQAQIQVLVSIAPQKYLVERIGGDHVSVTVIVPQGANSHTYEPSTKQVLAAQKGDIWFRIGESFENRMLAMMRHTRVVDQRQGLDLIQAGCGCCTHDAHDPHIWLSPRLLKVQAKQIAEMLCEYDHDHAEFFMNNLSKLVEECSLLDQECALMLAKSTVILVSHPAFGYLCRDYGLKQLSIEMEGREPTPRYVTELITRARSLGVKIVFLQLQHNPKGGKRIAKELRARTVYLDPYVENVLENLRSIAQNFSEA
jgi:zinc transport system substrate-binding protein